MNDVDYSQRTADDDSDPLNHGLIRRLRGITGLRYAPFLNDPALARRFLLGNTVVEEEAQNPGESKNTSASQDALLLQNRARGQRFSTDQKIGGVHPGESQHDSEEAADRRRQWTNAEDSQDDFEYFGRDGAARWNAMRRKL